MSQQDDISFEDFFSKLWFCYPEDLCHGKKGVKFKAQKACEKLKPEQYNQILMNVEALKKYDRQDVKPDRWPHVSTFINQAYYDRDIGSATELKEKRESQICTECDQETIGPRYTVCPKHTETHAARLKMMSILKEIGVATPGQSLQELSQSCQEWLRTNKGFGKLFAGMTSSEKPADSGSR
jgi:hypothetical protein